MNTLRRKIVLVDDNITILTMGNFILNGKYNIFTVPSGEKLFRLLEKVLPDLILLDIEMPEMNGYEVIKRLKAERRTAGIPVIFLTAKNDIGSELEGLNLGAIDYLSKPFSPPLLLKRIELHLLVENQRRELLEFNTNLQKMVRDKTKTVLDMQNSVLKTVADLVEHRDQITGDHVDRTRKYLEFLLDAIMHARRCTWMKSATGTGNSCSSLPSCTIWERSPSRTIFCLSRASLPMKNLRK